MLGCGGTISKHCLAGDDVSVLIMADGVTSRDNFKHSAIEERRNATLLANEILGINDLTILSYPDNQMDSVTRLELIKVIEGAIERCHPDIIYRHHAGDVNIDH